MHQNEPLIIYFIDIKTDFRDYNGKTNFVFILQLSLKKNTSYLPTRKHNQYHIYHTCLKHYIYEAFGFYCYY